MLENILKGVRFLLTGQFRRVWNEVHVRIYRAVWSVLWWWIMPWRRAGRPVPLNAFQRETLHPVAFASPDHIAPKGTAVNNSTNKKFILRMDARLHREFGNGTLRMLDLGCAGGQTVADFITLRWQGAGLEGSDFSLKYRRANWKMLADTNLFTCDITKPYQITLDGRPATFHLITAWEVLEHIATPDLDQVFNNIRAHLEPGGYFIASTTETSDLHNGLELHQTQWNNRQWRKYVETTFPDLEHADVGLRIYQFVRYNFLHPSFLTYRKRKN